MILIQNKVFNPDVVNILVNNTSGQLRLGIQSIDGRIKTLVDEQIASFVELSVKGGGIDEETAQEIRNSFKHIITDLSTREGPSLSNLREQHSILYAQVEKHILKANENGKKILILVGEDHRDRKSLILELMILDIANRLGIKNLLTETTNGLLENIKHMPTDEVMSPNFSFVLKFAQKLGFETTPCDPEQFNSIEKVRVVAMNQAIVKSNTNSTFFVGVNHLIDISTDEAINETYEILSINASNIGDEKKSHLFKSLSYPKHRLNFALNPGNAIQLNIPGNPYSFEFKQIKKLVKQINLKEESIIPEVVQISVEHKSKAVQIDNVVLPILEAKEKYEEDPVIESLNQKLKEYPKNVANRLQRASILYSRGRKSEALEDYRFVIAEYPANREAQKGIQNCT